MSVLDLFRRRKDLASSRLLAAGVQVVEGERVVGMGTDVRAYATEGYAQNIVAYRAVNAIATAAAAIPVLVFVGEDEVESDAHPLRRLLRRPTPRHSWRSFFMRAVSSVMISGNSYLRRIVVGGAPRELWVMRPDRVRVIGTDGSAALVRRFEYRSSPSVGPEVYDVDPVTGACDVRQVALYHPTDDLVGLSPIGAAASGIDLWNASNRWNYNLLKRSASKKVGLFVTPDKDGRVPRIDPALKRAIVKDFNDALAGEGNAGGALVIDGGLEPKELSFSPKDMEWINSKNTSSRDVAIALGFPPQLLGIPGDNTYSNYQEARRASYEDTILPVAFAVLEELNAWLDDGSGARFVFDVEAIPAIARDRVEMWDKVSTSTFLTINEKRAVLGYDERDDGDVILVPLGTTPLELVLDPPPPPEPTPPPNPADADADEDDDEDDDEEDPTVEQERAAFARALRRHGISVRRARYLAREAVPGRPNGHAR